jgi:hypothetical protein
MTNYWNSILLYLSVTREIKIKAALHNTVLVHLVVRSRCYLEFTT